MALLYPHDFLRMKTTPRHVSCEAAMGVPPTGILHRPFTSSPAYLEHKFLGLKILALILAVILLHVC